ncbi:MAG: response regulator [Ignavibacteriales bacterium]|nr:response regulator [Ignavibacteriales bacterium]
MLKVNNQTTILVVDDEVQIRRLLKITLESNDCNVIFAETGEEGVRRAGMDRPELIILDLGLPDMDGQTVLKNIRELSDVPIIILSVRNSEQDVVNCLNSGADDYLTKPFRSGELLARVRTALRHHPAITQDEQFKTGNLSVDFSNRVVAKSNDIVKLTPIEYKLLVLLVRNAGRVLTHQYILEQVWGPTFIEESEYTRVYVGQLRKKIEDNPSNPKLLLTESGIGYRLAILD